MAIDKFSKTIPDTKQAVVKPSALMSEEEQRKAQEADEREAAKESKIVRDAQIQSDKDQVEHGKKLDAKFGNKGRGKDKAETLERMKEISKLLRDSIKKTDNAKKDVGEFSLALQEKRADLPNKLHLTVEEFNDWLNDLNMILQERDRAAQSSEDTLTYVIQKIRADSIG